MLEGQAENWQLKCRKMSFSCFVSARSSPALEELMSKWHSKIKDYMYVKYMETHDI